MKRMLSLTLALVMVLSLFAGCGGGGNASVTPETLDEELREAYDMGLLPDEWLEDMSVTVTVADFNSQLTKVVAIYDEALVPQWEELAAQALKTSESCQRDDAILSIFETAILIGIDEEAGIAAYVGLEGISTAEDWWEGQTRDYSYFPGWEQHYKDSEYDVYMHGVWFVESHVSLDEELYIFEPTEHYTFGLGQEVSREEAARALLRYVKSSPVFAYGERNYMDVSDIGTYDKNIITDELLNAPTELPEVAQSKLPDSWQGVGISARKSYVENFLPYEETDVAFLKENGFNFARLFFGFSTLRFPEYPEDGRLVNENEFKELDQLLAWCIEYGVHLQIAMSFYLDEGGNAVERMPENDAEWELVTAYWEALARRYAGIDSRYLSFDLSNEICPQPNEVELMAYSKQGFTKLVETVRAADSERVLLHSFSGYSVEEWSQLLGELNVAIGCHPYRPHMMASGEYPESEFLASNLYWPRPRFASILYEGDEVIIEGEGLAGTLSVNVLSCDMEAVLQVYADGTLIQEVFLPDEGELNEYGGYDLHDKAFYFDIPKGTEKIKLCSGRHGMSLTAVGIENESFHTWLMCHDAYESEEMYSSSLSVDADGVWTNADGLMSDGEYVFETQIAPLKSMAERYNVGFMVNEFGLFGVDVHWDIGMVTKYHDEYLRMLEEHDVPWCYNELFNDFAKHIIVLYGDESQWTGAMVEDYTITLNDGSTETVKVCKELLDTFAKYTLNGVPQ